MYTAKNDQQLCMSVACISWGTAWYLLAPAEIFWRSQPFDWELSDSFRSGILYSFEKCAKCELIVLTLGTCKFTKQSGNETIKTCTNASVIWWKQWEMPFCCHQLQVSFGICPCCFDNVISVSRNEPNQRRKTNSVLGQF